MGIELRKGQVWKLNTDERFRSVMSFEHLYLFILEVEAEMVHNITVNSKNSARLVEPKNTILAWLARNNGELVTDPEESELLWNLWI